MSSNIRSLALVTAGKSERCIFSREGCIVGHEVVFIIYLPLDLEVNKRFHIDCLGLMAEIK